MKQDETRAQHGAVRLEATYPHPPQRVWEALTDPRALGEWLLPTTFRPARGHRFAFTERRSGGRRRKIRCQVVELEAPHRLAYTWQAEEDSAPTLVTWTLEPVEGGTRLRLEHIGAEQPFTATAGGGATTSNRLRTAASLGASRRGLMLGLGSDGCGELLILGRILLPAHSQPIGGISRAPSCRKPFATTRRHSDRSHVCSRKEITSCIR